MVAKEIVLDKIDAKDRQLLYLLDVDGRAAFADLGRKTRMSKQRVAYRVGRLEEQKIIKGYATLIDTSRLGYTTFRVYLKLRTLSAAHREELLKFLTAKPQVWALYTFGGRYDLALGIAVCSHAEFYEVWDSILAHSLPVIKDYAISIYSPVYHYTKAYLVGKPDNVAPRVLGAGALVASGEMDWKILRLLAANARISLVDVGAAVKLTPEAVKHRVRALEKNGVIQGYRAIIDVQKLGYQYFKADIRLRSTAKLREIQSFCAEHQNIYQFNRTIGGETLEIEFNVPALSDMLAILEAIESRFPGAMESFEYLTITEERKTQYMPGA